jgi:hypothetical protein
MRHYQVAGVGLLAGALAFTLGHERASAAEDQEAGPFASEQDEAADELGANDGRLEAGDELGARGERSGAAGPQHEGSSCPCADVAGGTAPRGGATTAEPYQLGTMTGEPGPEWSSYFGTEPVEGAPESPAAPGLGELEGLPGWSPSIGTRGMGGYEKGMGGFSGTPEAGGFGAGLGESGSFALGPLESGASGEGAMGARAPGTGEASSGPRSSFGAGIGGGSGRASEAPFASPFMLGPLPKEPAPCPGERRP